MAVRRFGGGFLAAFLLASANLVRERSVAEALAGAPLELTSQALAQTPASAEAPATGAGPSITRSKQIPKPSYVTTTRKLVLLVYTHEGPLFPCVMNLSFLHRVSVLEFARKVFNYSGSVKFEHAL